MSNLTGWHPGERSIQEKLGFADKVTTSWTWIVGDLPYEHAQFYESCLPFIPVTTLDGEGRPWGSILSGKNGSKGFVQHRNFTKLEVEAETWEGDPLSDNLSRFKEGEKLLIAGIGVEFPTRRRNKFAGAIQDLKKSGNDITMELLVNEAIGNCPKYINIRDLEPVTGRNLQVIYDRKSLSAEDQLPSEITDFILSRDTVFLGTSYVPPPDLASKFPPHVGMNHRGGLPGFIRVRNDKRTIVLPDYSGNRLMTSLGNIESTPLASLTFVDFVSGDILYLTGSATNIIGPAAHDIMPFTNALTLLQTTGFIFVRDALPVRQIPSTIVKTKPSPYSPPIRLLAEESSMSLFQNDDRPDAQLVKIDIHSQDVMSFTWESSKPLTILPGQAIILDCSTLLGDRQYQHMAPLNPTSVNDDRIRTWTVSSASPTSQQSTEPSTTKTFSVTLRHKPGGALTTAFFSIAAKMSQMMEHLLADTRPLNLTVKIAGVTGSFTLPPALSSSTITPSLVSEATSRTYNLVWFAGGIGITPFLSMLAALQSTTTAAERVNVHLYLSTRDAVTLLPLVLTSYEATSNVCLSIDVLHSTHDPAPTEGIIRVPDGVVVKQYAKRLDTVYLEEHKADILGKDGGVDVYVCGPEDYTQMITQTVKQMGVEPDRVHSEGFSY